MVQLGDKGCGGAVDIPGLDEPDLRFYRLVERIGLVRIWIRGLRFNAKRATSLGNVAAASDADCQVLGCLSTDQFLHLAA